MNSRIWLVCVLSLVVFCGSISEFVSSADAAAQVVEIEGVGFNVNHSLTDNLKALKGKKVYLALDSGKTLAGIISEVGEHLLHLEKLEGKEYFDALIRIEEIGAIDTRFREQKR